MYLMLSRFNWAHFLAMYLLASSQSRQCLYSVSEVGSFSTAFHIVNKVLNQQ